MQKICIVIPCYNEQYRLPVEDFILSYTDSNYFFLFVNDGSKDSTLDVLNNIRKGREDRFFILDCKVNGGKAEAVRQGMLTALKMQDLSIIGYLDADLATPLTEVSKITNRINGPVLFAFGSRIKMIGTTIQRKWQRHIFGRVFATIASIILKIGVYDTQCGAKFFDKNIVGNIFSEKFKTKWIFDLEIFFRFKGIYKIGNITVTAKEVPLDTWKDISGSKLKLIHLLNIPFELIKLRSYL